MEKKRDIGYLHMGVIDNGVELRTPNLYKANIFVLFLVACVAGLRGQKKA